MTYENIEQKYMNKFFVPIVICLCLYRGFFSTVFQAKKKFFYEIDTCQARPVLFCLERGETKRQNGIWDKIFFKCFIYQSAIIINFPLHFFHFSPIFFIFLYFFPISLSSKYQTFVTKSFSLLVFYKYQICGPID